MLNQGQDQRIPAWGGFNAFLDQSNITKSVAHYLPFINASPSDHSTIYTALVNLVKIANKLDQKHILVTADMSIYSKAQQIIWGNPSPLLGRITMRIGNMHLIMACISCLGKLYGDGGLLLAMTESGVYTVYC